MSLNTTTPWLEIERLTFLRGERTILQEVDLAFRAGELTLLTGQNGSGKTTLLRILAGLLKPQQVAFRFAGDRHKWRQSYRFLRDQICYLHQQPYLFDSSVADNIGYGLRCQRLSRKVIRRRVQEALELISLEHLADRNSLELSGGEKQRVAIARAWVLSPRMMLLDEPVASLDKRSRGKCYDLMNQLQQQRISVVYTSHEPQLGHLNLNRHIHLYQGHLTNKPVQSDPHAVLELVKPPHQGRQG